MTTGFPQFIFPWLPQIPILSTSPQREDKQQSKLRLSVQDSNSGLWIRSYATKGVIEISLRDVLTCEYSFGWYSSLRKGKYRLREGGSRVAS